MSANFKFTHECRRFMYHRVSQQYATSCDPQIEVYTFIHPSTYWCLCMCVFHQNRVFVTPTGRIEVLCPVGTTSFEAYVACVLDITLSKSDRLLHLRTAFPGEDPRALSKRVGLAKQSVRQRGFAMRPSIVNASPPVPVVGNSVKARCLKVNPVMSAYDCIRPYLHVCYMGWSCS